MSLLPTAGAPADHDRQVAGRADDLLDLDVVVDAVTGAPSDQDTAQRFRRQLISADPEDPEAQNSEFVPSLRDFDELSIGEMLLAE